MWSLLCVVTMGWGRYFRIEPVPISPGLYYQHEGTARLYTSEWKVVTFLSLQQASNNVDTKENT